MFDLREMAQDNVLVAAHRGTVMGNIPCNTAMSFRAALDDGADIIELDIACSLDGTPYVFHPGTEPKYLNSQKRIANMTDAEVQSLYLYNPDFTQTQYKVPLFDDILEELKGKCVINIDKFPMYPQQIVAAVRRHDMVEQVLVKTNQEEALYKMVEELCPDFPYMTFAYEKDPDSEMLVHRKLRYLGTEAVFATEESEFAKASYSEKMHQLGLLTWVNAIVFDYKRVLCAGYTDDVSVSEAPEKGWGHLAEIGYDMIQTDWTAKCVNYLKAAGYRK